MFSVLYLHEYEHIGRFSNLHYCTFKSHVFRERNTLCFGSCQHRALKINVWWVEAHEKRKRAFFATLILCRVYQCIEDWIKFDQNFPIEGKPLKNKY